MTAIQTPIFAYFEDDLSSSQIVKVLLTRVMQLQHLNIFGDTANPLGKLDSLEMQPNIFFLDIQMKPHDGYEVLHILRNDPRFADAIIIAMTANVMSHDVEKLKQAGFDGLIGKPILKDTFPQLIERILNGQAVWFVP